MREQKIGERIRLLRKLKGMSQEEVAKKLGLKGKDSVCKIESRGDDVSFKTIKKYAECLEVSIMDIIGER